LLRRASLTVEELADALGVTDNAVRAQLTSLERDGLVRQAGLRRGSGKPSYSYALTADFEPTLSRAYIPLLVRLLRELRERMPEEEVVALLRQVGRRWGDELSLATSGPGAKLAAASALLNDLGGVTEVEKSDQRCTIRGYSCPLGVAAKEHPGVCAAIEALLSELLGTAVHERCDRAGERPRCCFEVGG
jgi:predicted ArsR family transcriptional regulator